MTKSSGSNSSRLFVPEPPFRPGDTPDYSHISVPVAHTPPRPDPMCEAHETTLHATRLIRVLRFSGEAEGDWANLPPARDIDSSRRKYERDDVSVFVQFWGSSGRKIHPRFIFL